MPLPPMIPISASGKDPPGKMTEEWQARDYTKGNSLACGGTCEHLLLHLISSGLIQALAHQYRIPPRIDHNRALFREPRVFASEGLSFVITICAPLIVHRDQV